PPARNRPRRRRRRRNRCPRSSPREGRAMTEKHSHRSVAGTVTSPAGPAAGITVTAVHRTVSGDTPLKTATTDPSGRYSLAYSTELPSDRVNLVVRAAGEDATIE